MHGIVFGELKQYVSDRFGAPVWDELLANAAIGPKLYLAIQEYPDEELNAILQAASTHTGLPIAALLQDFGDFTGPHLVRMYQPEWKTLDVIEHTEERIHKMVRLTILGHPAVWHNGALPATHTHHTRSRDGCPARLANDRYSAPSAALATAVAMTCAWSVGAGHAFVMTATAMSRSGK